MTTRIERIVMFLLLIVNFNNQFYISSLLENARSLFLT